MELFWEFAGWETSDKHLADLRRAPFVRPFPAIDLTNQPALFVIRGPRQIGKSSWLKTLLSSWPSPREAFYLSCENIDSFKELSVLLASLRSSRRLILLDEVSFVREWPRAVKHEIDAGYRGTIIVTGSHAGDLRAGADQMPGRFGAGGEIHLLPMSFDEFCAARQQAHWPESNRLSLLRQFFMVGGLPASVIEAGPHGTRPQQSIDTYQRWLIGDAIKAGKNEAFLRGLLAELVRCLGTGVSLQSLARRTEIASHHTVQDYIHFLEDCFALRVGYAIDANTGAFKFRSEKKFYFSDPLIFWLASQLGGLPTPSDWEAHIAEMVGFEALWRLTQARHERFGYYRDKRGEIDYFAPKRWAIELKWSPVARNISPAFYNVAAPQKLVWTQENFLKDWPAIL